MLKIKVSMLNGFMILAEDMVKLILPHDDFNQFHSNFQHNAEPLSHWSSLITHFAQNYAKCNGKYQNSDDI